MTEAYRPISGSQLWYPHAFRFDNDFVEAAVIFRFPDQKLVGPFLSHKSIKRCQRHCDL